MINTMMIYGGAITLGAFHAFEPGHGKTLIAAYMIGTKGRAWDGFILGAIVTFTHTFSVVLLGLAAKLLSHNYSESELHNWLGLFSAALILGVGLWMLRQRLFGSGRHGHFHLFGSGHNHSQDLHGHSQHDHSQHDHAHHDHDHHDHDHAQHDHEHHEQDHHDHHGHNGNSRVFNKWNLLLLGISGGIIPCPAAIATLLAAVAAGRIAEGLAITIFFSIGLGMVMMSIGVALSQAGRLTTKIGENLEFGRRMGIVSAVIIVVLGSYTMFTSIKNIWFLT